MKSIRCVICCLLCCFWVISATAKNPHSPARGGAELTLKVSGYDFGKIAARGGDVHFDFEFTNTGSAPLVITKVITSCNCTKASFSKKPVVAGAQGVIKMTFEPKTQHGTFCKLINIYTNDPNGVKIVYLKGEVE